MFPKDSTIRDLYEPAMKITDQVGADVYFEHLVEYAMGYGQTREEAERIQKCNLGYYAGYHDAETRERVERLFCCEHPIFGAIATRGQPSSEEAFNAGLAAARRLGKEESPDA